MRELRSWRPRASAPPSTRRRALLAGTTATALVAPLVLLAAPAQAVSPDVARGASATASSQNAPYVASNLTDGSQGTYWESANNAFPQSATIDLGASYSVEDLTLMLPTGWGARTQTIAVATSTDGSAFSTISAAKAVAFDPGAGNRAALDVPDTSARYVRLTTTANTGWPAAQLSEVEVHGVATGGPTPTPTPTTTPPPAGDTQLATGRPAVASSTQWVYGAGNAVDGNLGTYWESAAGQWPARLDVDLAARSVVSQVSVALDPAAVWGPRTQRIAVEGRTGTGSWSTLAAAKDYAFSPGSGNRVTIPVSATADDVRVVVSSNTGSSGAQIAELGVLGHAAGTPSPTPTPTATTTPTPTPTPTPTTTPPVEGRDLSAQAAATASSTGPGFAAANVTDRDPTTYWESGAGLYPATVAVDLGTEADLSGVTVRLNPASAWGPRTQTFSIEGRTGSGSWTTLKSSASRQFDPATGNTVTVPVTGKVSQVRLSFSANSGAPGAQVAELVVTGTPAANPDLAVTQVTTTPANPVESDTVTVRATVKNVGQKPSPASTVDVLLDGDVIGTANLGALAAGATGTASVDAGALAAGSYTLGAVVDPKNTVTEQDETNNRLDAADPLVVTAVPSSDLVPVVSWNPSSPAAGATTTFSVAVANQGNVASAGGAHAVTVKVTNDSGTVKTLTGAVNGTLAAGSTSAPVQIGTWTAADGTFTVETTVAADANEVAGKRANNTDRRSLFVGVGANMPYDYYEAEDGVVGGGATKLGPNRVVGDLAGEANGRRAVTLGSTGSYVEWTTKAPTNSLVTRFSIPDAPGGGGTESTIDVFVDGKFTKRLDLTSRYAWLYGNETNPGNEPGAGGPRHIYDEASTLLPSTVPAGSKIRLQKTAANTSTYTIDFINLEMVSPDANPDKAAYIEPRGFTHQDVQNALDTFRQDTTGKLKGVYLPAGDYSTERKFQVYGKAVDIVGAGPWYTRFFAPQNQSNTDVGWRAEKTANGSKFRGFAYFGNYTSRIDGPGKVLDLNGVSDITVDDLWVEHMICMFWAANMDSTTITNSRIRNTFADGINMTNGSANNRISNIEARSTGDDSFALFAATDAGARARPATSTRT
nr:discoidin domain-containing protein [Paraoerskovia sediminicola]